MFGTTDYLMPPPEIALCMNRTKRPEELREALSGTGPQLVGIVFVADLYK